ncbi:hypothetical protein MMC28_003828 [Mycoblastus sanguinarius]|nr:hypothetical protein [Mycoblastus sanguinarius]
MLLSGPSTQASTMCQAIRVHLPRLEDPHWFANFVEFILHDEYSRRSRKPPTKNHSDRYDAKEGFEKIASLEGQPVSRHEEITKQIEDFKEVGQYNYISFWGCEEIDPKEGNPWKTPLDEHSLLRSQRVSAEISKPPKIN